MTGGFANYFLFSALLYFAASAVLGFLMILSWMGGPWKGWEYYLIPTHAHLMLLGWVSMTIYGMMYRVVPAFYSRRLYSERLAWIHLFIANLATIGMGIFFYLNRLQEGQWVKSLAASGALQLLGVLLFVFNMFASIFVGRTKLEKIHDSTARRP